MISSCLELIQTTLGGQMDASNDGTFTHNFDDVKKAEFEYIEKRRENLGLNKELNDFGEKISKLKKQHTGEDWEFKSGKIGLAFSGGGIRSATFNLGILQALARKNILRFCDYLSTVSGGGYIGSCLSSLLANSKASVALKNFPFRFQREQDPDERQEVKWLRRHGNYLFLNKSLFGLDLWRFIGLYLSGLVLTNITTISLTIFLNYIIYLIVHFVTEPLELAGWLVKLSAGVLIVMVVARWGATLRNLKFKSRYRRGLVQGYLARTAALFTILGGFILLAVYLPQLSDQTSNFAKDLLNGGIAASAGGLLLNLIKSKNETFQKIKKMIISIAMVALLLILLAQFIRWIWATDIFVNTTLGIPTLVLVAIILFIISIFTNTNRISMHHFYRDRLSEAYIFKRDKIGADETINSNEELELKDLHSQDNGAPYQLINTTLNIPASNNRWLRGRGADFFLFSKYYCGAESTGYSRTEDYENGETRLATAMAISGAAASPQMGTSTSPLLTFIMTLFNIRLNRWMPNPNPTRKAYLAIWPFYFINELFHKEKETDRLLNLSDGGHHENLGIYELIKRRCEIIIATDCGADPNFNYGDLANMMRKIRIDQGVVINFSLAKNKQGGGLQNLRPDEKTKNTKKNYAVGSIEYPDGSEGVLIYIKSSVTGDESEDLLAYRRKNPTFPDQTTADQFFDEDQFESYRELGYLIGKKVFS